MNRSASRSHARAHAILCLSAGGTAAVLAAVPVWFGVDAPVAGQIEHAYSAIGILTLLVPAFHLSKYGYLLIRLADAKRIASGDLAELVSKLERDTQTHRDSWSIGKARCFVFGSAFALAGELLPLALAFLG